MWYKIEEREGNLVKIGLHGEITPLIQTGILFWDGIRVWEKSSNDQKEFLFHCEERANAEKTIEYLKNELNKLINTIDSALLLDEQLGEAWEELEKASSDAKKVFPAKK